MRREIVFSEKARMRQAMAMQKRRICRCADMVESHLRPSNPPLTSDSSARISAARMTQRQRTGDEWGADGFCMDAIRSDFRRESLKMLQLLKMEIGFWDHVPGI